MLREVAYSLLLPSARSELHATALRVLEQALADDPGPVAAELAHHAREAAREAGPDEALRLRRAEARFLHMAIGRASRRDDVAAQLELTALQLANEAADPAQRLRAHITRCGAFGNRGQSDQLLHAAQELALCAAQQGNTDAEFDGLAFVVQARLAHGKPELAQQAIREAEAGHRSTSDYALARLAAAKASVANATGDDATAEAGFTAALAAWQRAGVHSMAQACKGNLANLLGGTGRRAQAEAMLRELAAELEAEGNQRVLGVALVNIARQCLGQRRLEEAEDLFRRALVPLRATGQLRSESFALGNLAEVLVATGRLDEATAALDRALELTSELALPVYHAAYQCTRAGLLLLLGHEREAQELVEVARGDFEATGSAAYIPEFCDIWRLRIAAGLACTEPAQRGTARLAAQPPQAAWVRVVREVLAGMTAALQCRRNAAGTDLARNVNAGEALLAELEAAVREGRAALVYYGYLVSELRPELRRALLQRLGERRPSWVRAMKAARPDLFAALTAP
ncbi:MAG: hypothetical protein IT463_04175 [Planctomycetes bacterium]|nr:hypothetical protein [Planctomycetota bacterium]